MSELYSNEKFTKTWDLTPTGDQPAAIEKITSNISQGIAEQILLGVTGSGKTFTMANVIYNAQKPTLILAHNKTLAAQLFQEFKDLFPNNAVEFFISYYDYYQPEAYVPSSDTYIEKVSSINDEIDKMRHSATRALLERRDVIVVASVSCIYGLGNPKEYLKNMFLISENTDMARDDFIRLLISIQYERNDLSLERGKFRVRGDVVELVPAYEKNMAIRVVFWGSTIEKISIIDALRGTVIEKISRYAIFPNTHYIMDREKLEEIIEEITKDLDAQLQLFQSQGKILEAERVKQRTLNDISLLRELGFCSGIENYSRYLDGRKAGESPATLLDYFPHDFLMFIDESHVSVPQVGAMYRGDRMRKETLVNYGFRLPSALDNRPLNFTEFKEKISQVIYVSATPGKYEMEHAGGEIVEQIIRPTGLIDPKIDIKPVNGQVDDLLFEIKNTVARGFRVLVTTLTKKMSEELADYYAELGIKVKYLHSEIVSIERVQILRDLRLGIFDVLIGINLLREGLDLPEVELVAILDADKEGFLRSRSSLIQTVGRAARNVNGRVILYADSITESMRHCLEETDRRRLIQEEYNIKNNITPVTINKKIPQELRKIYNFDYGDDYNSKLEALSQQLDNPKILYDAKKLDKEILKLTREMQAAAQRLDFETAAELRDKITLFKEQVLLLA